MCSSNSNVFSGDEVMQNYDLGRKDFVYMKEMDEIFENKTNIYPEILLDGANVVAEAATTNQPSDQAAPGPSGYSTKDSASTSTHPHKKLKLKSRTVRDFQEERINYLQERLEMERERQKKRDEREKERLQLKRESLELKREWMEVNRSLLNATLEHNMLLRKYFEARMSSLTKFHF
ncbi:uncharacterized protein LOC124553738 isoform X1 [Schistocerca americana]|uniref:uncharacterized protein LOC124553738 isoform X1 n=1 Tax=Schistocerca americana TaxID=7009 RepID=UPI001F4F7301|nr:uncharacterized protein LOC124553738 isoform X1 [Schistocerca americana]